MSSRFYHALLLVFIFFLFACTSPTPTSLALAPTNIIAKTNPQSSLTSPQPTQSRPTQTPEIIEAPPTPESFTGSLAGLIYYDQQGIWKIAPDGEHVLIYDFEGVPHSSIKISPNLDKIISTREARTFITDIYSGESHQINAYGDYTICKSFWWPAHPDIILVGIRSIDEEIGRFCETIPALKTWNGPLVEVLATKTSWPATMSGSPNGSQVAFDDNAVPWIYIWGEGKEPFDIASYGFPEIANARLSNPAWSGSGRWLAWLVFSDEESSEGIGVFDTFTRTSQHLAPYFIQGNDAAAAFLEWSPDESHIMLINHGENYIRVINIETEEVVYSHDDVESGIAGFSSDGKWIFHLERKSGFQASNTILMALDQSERIRLIFLAGELWHPDGKFILLRSRDDFQMPGRLSILDLTTGNLGYSGLSNEIVLLAWAAD